VNIPAASFLTIANDRRVAHRRERNDQAARERYASIPPAPIRTNIHDRRAAPNRERNVQNPLVRYANIPAGPLPTDVNDRRVARNGNRRPRTQLLEQEVIEVEAGIGERVRRMEARSINVRGTRPPRLVGQETNIRPTRLAVIMQQMQEHGIDLPGPEPPRNAGQEAHDWDRQFQGFTQQMQDHGIINFPRSELSGNAGLEENGQGVRATDFHIRTIEDAGFRILPEIGRLSTAREHEEILGRRAANRRQVALRERDLYTSLIARGAHLPQPENPMDELLDHRQDQALFAWLQRQDAFRGLALNETYRTERNGGSQPGRTRNNREIYDMLRDCGVFWEMENYRNGRWRTRGRFLFDDEEEGLSDTFQELLLDDAFADPGIRRLFPDRDDYYIFRRVLEIRATWDSRRRQWQRRSSQTGSLMAVVE